ncbi:hypothetical protein [Saccharomonospora viridis]|uniref:hypothetical protein n=1 Tax=Saccharomonospora viridis TaxID=1852 RepID=UPI0024093ECB|nr:hypothetical protein [Saccharomonospora viridis]
MTALRGVIGYELRMQLRKRSLWLVLGALLALEFGTQGPNFPTNLPADTPLRQTMGAWALTFNLIAPIGIGVLLADRLVRDRRLGVEDMLEGLPVRPGTRLWGKYLGVLAAGSLPILLCVAGAAGYEAIRNGDVTALGWGLLAFGGVNLPGLAFITAFALLVPAVLSAPLFRVLFVGYWFWGNLLNPDVLPTLTGSLLTPVGDYAAAGLFDADPLWAGWPGFVSALRPHLSPGAGVASIALLVGIAVVVLFLGQLLLTRSRARA